MPGTQKSIKGRVASLNVGEIREIAMGNRTVRTGIFKTPVNQPLHLAQDRVESDHVVDWRVHGGPYKAVYLYPSEHYPYWRENLERATLMFGSFGENLTAEGVLEEEVKIGDRFRVGSAILQATQLRMPCYKLGLRFERTDMVKRFWASGFAGIYFAIVQDGVVEPGSAIEKIGEGPEDVTIADVVRLYKGEEWSAELRERALRAPLYGSWKKDIRARLTASATPVL